MARRATKAAIAVPAPIVVTSSWERLTLIAFALLLMLVLTRATLSESLREPFEVTPGSPLMPKSPGPAASVGLDLLCCMPALLVLLRRVMDREYVLRFSWSFIPLALLCGWMALSTTWAADRFAAIITAFHWVAAAALLWAAAQLVRGWLELRLVAAVYFGLLCVYLTQATSYRLRDLPELRREWREHKIEILHDRGYAPNSFAAEQLGKKIESGEFYGFNTSPNSFGAILVFLTTISAGLMIQRHLDGVRPTVIAGFIVIPLSLLTIAATRSKAAIATLFLAGLIFAVIWKWRSALAGRARQIYFSTFGVVVLLLAAVVLFGLRTGHLFGLSLTFRWYYWVGAARIMRSGLPLLLHGTGWDNFGVYYVQHRLAQAAEEVKDPHNFIVRFFVELGLFGGILMLAWMIRLWWEMTQPAIANATHSLAPVHRGEGGGEGSSDEKRQRSDLSSRPSPQPSPLRTGEREPVHALALIGAVAGGVLLLTVGLAPDWSQDWGYLLGEGQSRLIYAAAILIPAVLAAVHTLQEPRCDDRPAPWVLFAMLIGLGMFLLHNLVDFSLFETGPMCIFSLLAGGAMGIQSVSGSTRRGQPAWALAGAVVLWLVAAGGLWAPTLLAERAADAGDQALHDKHFDAALQDYLDAATDQPLNADYAYRAARAAMYFAPQQVGPCFATAIAANPRQVRYHLDRARYEAGAPHPNAEQIRADYRTALALDPNDMLNRLEFADELVKLGSPDDRAAARIEYAKALELNDQLSAVEVRRLTPEQIETVRRKMAPP